MYTCTCIYSVIALLPFNISILHDISFAWCDHYNVAHNALINKYISYSEKHNRIIIHLRINKQNIVRPRRLDLNWFVA